MFKKYYLGGFFWAPIPHKRYQNTSGFAGVYMLPKKIVYFINFSSVLRPPFLIVCCSNICFVSMLNLYDSFVNDIQY